MPGLLRISEPSGRYLSGGPGLSRIEFRLTCSKPSEDQQEREDEFEEATGGEEQHAGTGVDVGDAESGARRAEQERRVAPPYAARLNGG